jgi:CRP-like cAMP-binding protein
MTDAAETQAAPVLSLEELKEFVPFNILSSHYLGEAQAALRVHKAAKGKLIFKRGKHLDSCFYLLEGKVDLIDNAFEVSQVQAGTERASVALNQESPTTASAIAKSECVFFTIDKEYLDRLVGWSQSTVDPRAESSTNISEIGVEEMDGGAMGDWMTNLLQAPLFTRVPMAQLQELFSSFENCFVKKDEQIVKEGERGEYFYVVAAGKARITNRLGSVDVEIGPGQYFGEESLIGNTLRNATVTMTSDGLLKRLTSESFNKLLISPVLRYLESNKLESLDKPYKLIDVKMPVEFRVQHVPGSINVPLTRLRQSLQSFSDSHVYVVPEDAGSRADIAVHLLCQAGFDAMILKGSKNAESA